MSPLGKSCLGLVPCLIGNREDTEAGYFTRSVLVATCQKRYRAGIMRALLQRVKNASVTVAGEITGSIGEGLLVLLGVEPADSADDVEWLANKLANLRIFPAADGSGLCERSVTETGGGVLVVSQFTLFASTKKGTKPSWHRAAKPDIAEPLCAQFVTRMEALMGKKVATGRFGAMMEVTLVNDGPVTILVDSKARE